MEERFKHRNKEDFNFNLNQKQQFKSFELKSKEAEIFKRMENVDFASKAKIKFNKKIDFKDAETAQEIKIKSTSESLKVDFQVVEGTLSGFFVAKSDGNNHLLALLEVDEDANSPHRFNSKGSVRTHILPPPQKLGSKAIFKVTDLVTGDEAVAECISVPIGVGLWNFFRNLFR